MRRACLLASVLLLSAVAPAPAGARSTTQGGGFFGGGAPQLRQVSQVRVTGQLTVSFHGDLAGGCSARGVCGYSGWVSWRPPPTGRLTILESHHRGHVSDVPSLSLETISGVTPQSGVTNADVQFAPGGGGVSSSCVDAVPGGMATALPLHRGEMTLTFGGAAPALLADRCAGPRAAAILPLLPAPAISLNAVRRGGLTVALTASRTFSAGGFAGTVQSTIVLRLGPLGKATRVSGGQLRTGTRYRQLTVIYRAQLGGSLTERVTGDTNPAVCGPLGACGVSGTVTSHPRVTAGEAELTLFAPASRPVSELLASVGLSRGPPSPAISASGIVRWTGGGVARADIQVGGVVCRDSTPLAGGGLILATGHGHLGAQYLPPSLFPGGSPAGECPGPLGGTGVLLGGGVVAGGATSIASLGRRTIRVPLDIGSTFSDVGYTVTTAPHMTLTLTRVSTRTTVITVPPGVTL